MQRHKPDKQSKQKTMRWGRYIKPYWLYFVLAPLCMMVEVVGEVLMPRFLAYIINFGAEQAAVEEAPALVAWLCQALGGGSYFVTAMMVGMILTALLMMLGGVGGAYFATRAAVNFAADLRGDLYAKVQSFSFANMDRYSAGSLVTRLTNDVTQMQNFVATMLRMTLRAPGMLIGALIMAYLLRPSLMLVLAVSLPLLILCLVWLSVHAFPRFRKMQVRLDGLNATVRENVTNMRVVKSFVREDYEQEKFEAANRAFKEEGTRAMSLLILISPLMTFFTSASTLAVMWFGGNMVLSDSMLVGDLGSFVTYLTQILSSLMMVTMLFMQLSRALASSARIREVMEETPDIVDGDDADASLTVREGAVEFRHVSFRYNPSSPERVLEDVSLTVPAGSTLGVIGSTGSGKSTLVSLIPRLYDVDEGQVLVDGIDVRRYPLTALRGGVGMVLQKNVLFSGSVADNLRWGDDQADEETLRNAARSACADDFVSAMPEGYESSLEQGGSNVSGGQKQRLCIARALLRRPKILILDDSTSAVDTATEASIRQALRTELPDATKIIIAQRITSVMEADRIVVLNEGRITGTGTHEELMASNVAYREIYESQMERAEKEEREC